MGALPAGRTRPPGELQPRGRTPGPDNWGRARSVLLPGPEHAGGPCGSQRLCRGRCPLWVRPHRVRSPAPCTPATQPVKGHSSASPAPEGGHGSAGSGWPAQGETRPCLQEVDPGRGLHPTGRAAACTAPGWHGGRGMGSYCEAFWFFLKGFGDGERFLRTGRWTAS